MNNALPKMKELVKECGINVLDDSFSCKGRAWGILNRSKPDVSDLERARVFAQETKKLIEDM